MIAIREICQSTKIFQWVSCSEWGTKGPRCPSRGCVDADTRKWKVSGRCARFDSPILEEFVSRVAERKDVTCTTFINAVRPLKADYRTARCIIQQLWAELVTIEGTVGVINGGNYEMIALRHRATQSLLLSDIHYIPGIRADPQNAVSGPRGPHHMRLHTGLVSLITVDGAQHAQLAKTAQGMDQTKTSFPSRMLNPAEFNITPWRGGYHVDTKTNVRNGASDPETASSPALASQPRGFSSPSNDFPACSNAFLWKYGVVIPVFEPPEGGVLNLQNFDHAGVDGTAASSEASALNTAVVVLPKNNKGVEAY
ncbi:hypothetical protein BDZ89DRAFT_1171108 [Hymenopellis radicata]|nr:hypothetical protein BDZ89DRAFT_1171108 [Hymenopellis radicata]